MLEVCRFSGWWGYWILVEVVEEEVWIRGCRIGDVGAYAQKVRDWCVLGLDRSRWQRLMDSRVPSDFIIKIYPSFSLPVICRNISFCIAHLDATRRSQSSRNAIRVKL